MSEVAPLPTNSASEKKRAKSKLEFRICMCWASFEKLLSSRMTQKIASYANNTGFKQICFKKYLKSLDLKLVFFYKQEVSKLTLVSISFCDFL